MSDEGTSWQVLARSSRTRNAIPALYLIRSAKPTLTTVLYMKPADDRRQHTQLPSHWQPIASGEKSGVRVFSPGTAHYNAACE
jgi:hypothetical protein